MQNQSPANIVFAGNADGEQRTVYVLWDVSATCSPRRMVVPAVNVIWYVLYRGRDRPAGWRRPKDTHNGTHTTPRNNLTMTPRQTPKPPHITFNQKDVFKKKEACDTLPRILKQFYPSLFLRLSPLVCMALLMALLVASCLTCHAGA